jgi:plastocyanin
MSHRFLALFLLLLGTACTPGASGAGGDVAAGTAQTVDVSLTAYAPAPTQAGTGAGYSPLTLTVPVGTNIRFLNTDGFAHTSTSIGGSGTTFPGAYPFTAAALNQTGATLSGGWTSGALNAGASSQILLADKPGTYIFGCFFHYEAPMRGVIVVH